MRRLEARESHEKALTPRSISSRILLGLYDSLATHPSGRSTRASAPPSFSSGACPDSRTAIQRLPGYCSQMVRQAMAMGTPIRVPGRPQRKLQKNTEKTTKNGEMD